VDAEAVALAGLDAGQVGVPDEGVDLVEPDALLGAGVVEQAQLDLLGDLGEDREVRAHPVVGGAQRISLARPHLHLHSLQSPIRLPIVPASRPTGARRRMVWPFWLFESTDALP
jgi:hypothetical protein